MNKQQTAGLMKKMQSEGKMYLTPEGESFLKSRWGGTMSNVKENKSVAFNLSDPYEEKLFEHSSQYPVFSAYEKLDWLCTLIKELFIESVQKGKNHPFLNRLL